ncbi:hypothetical protein BN11_4630006 [Nostocoides australiense Ben110]|uniref:Uncharacterized protein n=1 Tax=Nostocoides australiense Ben110 TaxID=1193182 RepID=W6K0T8_9MICO|nr:hypothetical protein BN11_4630006 [Tetrasphaera australiensis Ben110]
MERGAADVAPAQAPVLRKLLLVLAAAPGAELVQDRLAHEAGRGQRSPSVCRRGGSTRSFTASGGSRPTRPCGSPSISGTRPNSG